MLHNVLRIYANGSDYQYMCHTVRYRTFPISDVRKCQRMLENVDTYTTPNKMLPSMLPNVRSQYQMCANVSEC